MKDYRKFFDHVIDIILRDMFNIIHVEIGYLYKLKMGEGIPVKFLDLNSPRNHILEMLNIDKSDYNNIKGVSDILHILSNCNIINIKNIELTKLINADTMYFGKADSKPYVVEFFRERRIFLEQNDSYGHDLNKPPNELVYVDIIDYHLGINLLEQIRKAKVDLLV